MSPKEKTLRQKYLQSPIKLDMLKKETLENSVIIAWCIFHEILPYMGISVACNCDIIMIFRFIGNLLNLKKTEKNCWDLLDEKFAHNNELKYK